MSSLLGNFLTSMGGQIRDKENKAAEDAQWEKRQRLLADLEVERDIKLAKNKRKDGNTYKDASGQWVTEILDGNGNVTGTRSATQSEVSTAENIGYVAEGNKYLTARNKKQLDTFDEEHKLDMEGKRVQIASAQNSIANSNARLALDRQAADGASKEDKYLEKEGKDILYAISTLPVESDKDPVIIQLYKELKINIKMAREGAPGAKASLQVLKGKIAGLKERQKGNQGGDSTSATVNIPQGKR